MTIKEQAKDLVDKMVKAQGRSAKPYPIDIKCAIVCVDEIIDSEVRSGLIRSCDEKDIPRLTPREVQLDGSPRPISYWKQVKKEIELLL